MRSVLSARFTTQGSAARRVLEVNSVGAGSSYITDMEALFFMQNDRLCTCSAGKSKSSHAGYQMLSVPPLIHMPYVVLLSGNTPRR